MFQSLDMICLWQSSLWRAYHSKITTQILECVLCQWLCEDVSKLVFRPAKFQTNFLVIHQLSYKINLVSMCLVLLWNTWFFDNAMAELLSQKIVVGSWWFCDKSFKTLLIQAAWHAALVAATYSASAEDRVTMDCFFEAHETTPVPKWNVYPDALFLSSMLPTLSLSVSPIILIFLRLNT